MQLIMDNVEGLDIVAALENSGGAMSMFNTSSDSKAISMYAVSYTHLDVYKRQIIRKKNFHNKIS